MKNEQKDKMTNMIEKYKDKIEILEHDFPMQIAWIKKILNVPNNENDITQTEEYKERLKRVKENSGLNLVPKEFRKPPEEYKEWREKVKKDGELYFVPKGFRTPEMCRIAVEKFGGALQYVPDEIKTPEICRIAVENFSAALKSVPYKLKTLDLCEIAVKKNGSLLEYVPEELRTPEMCKIAMENHCYALQFVPEELKTKEMCRIAGENPYLLKWVPEKFITRELVDMNEEKFSKDILKHSQPYKDVLKYLKKEEKSKQRKQAVKNTKPTNEADKGKVDLSEAKGRKTIRITFNYKPDEVTLNEIKKQGFRWYRSDWGAFYTEYWRAFYTEEKYNWAINKFAGTTLADIIVSDAGLGDDINSETEHLNDGAIDYNEIHDKLQREMKNEQKDPFMSLNEMKEFKTDMIHFTNPINKALLGQIGVPFLMLLWGKAGGGKTTYALNLCNELAQYGKVLYHTSEEKLTSGRFINRMQLMGADNASIKFSEGGQANLIHALNAGKFKFVVIDSVNRVDMSESELMQLIREFGEISFILIAHADKTGKIYKGSSGLAHDVDTEVNITDGIATAKKHRDGETGHPINIFSQAKNTVQKARYRIAMPMNYRK